jgi:histidyl-tRNA synthetase
MAEKFQAVRGMNDILPEEARAWAFLEGVLRHWLGQYGYLEVRSPILESTALFTRSIGEVTDIVEKEMYSFVDRLNGENLTLRPEATAACVRLAVQHNVLYPGPQRLWYMGPMFRHERPQKGRYRQFHQCGAEALGFAGPDIDAELIVMTARLWALLGIKEVALEMNSIGSAACRARHREKLIAYLEMHRSELDDEGVRRLHSNPLRILDSKNPAMAHIIESAPRLTDDLDDESAQHFERLQFLLRSAGIPFVLNHRLVRGLDYYNGTVFEWTTPLLGAQSTICAGGRYDGLVEQLGGKPTPACGFAFGMERLLALIQETQSITIPVSAPDAYVVYQGEGTQPAAFLAADALRQAGLATVLYCGEGGFKNQLKRADSSGAGYAVILGEDEIRNQTVSIKPLRGQGQQQTVSLTHAIQLLKQERTHA